MLSVSVLGPVEVRRAGQVVAMPGGKSSELLVRLALDAGVRVPTDRLLDDVWGAEAVHTSRNTLQSKIVRLRRALGDPAIVEGGDGGYRLAVDPSAVDAVAALSRVAEATSLFERGDDQPCAEVCSSARALFRGEPLPGAGDWAVPHRARLEAARLHFIETECTARLRLGELGDVIGDLESATSEFPFQETLWAILITALYRSGRQSDALHAYQRVRAQLADELGLEPGPQLRLLEGQILAQDAALDGGRASTVAFAAAAPVGNLPTMATDLVGRTTELSALHDLVACRSLVVVVGPGGIGKTAIALAVARDAAAPGGVWFARLESATSADQVVDAVIAPLGVIGGEAALLERLKSSDTLLVLDNCEHVVEAVAELVERLLDAAPRTRILCTSQITLGIDGEAVFEVEPLRLADAVELFARRASTQRRNRPIDDTTDAIRGLCRSLDGLPLAIELAAARTRTLSIADISRRLDDRFDVLADPTSRKPARRRALRATIAWSYELLFPDDQRGLWALATFAGGATLAAVEHVLDALDVPPRTAIDVVGRLASRSLVLVDDGADGASRYRLLDSIRAFALDELAGAGLTDRAYAARAGWLASIAEGSTAGVRSARQAEHLDVARAERANIDLTLHWCTANDPPLALAIVNGFGWAWIVLGDSRGAQRILAALDAAGPHAPPRDRATALLLAAWIEASTGELERARQHIDEAWSVARRAGDVELAARSAYYLAYVVSHDGHFAEALRLTDWSGEVDGASHRTWDVAAGALFALRAATSAGDEARALIEADRARRALTAIDDPWLHVRFEATLGELARLQHRFVDAVDHLSRAVATSRRCGFLQTEAYQVACLGRAQSQAGDRAGGAATLELAIGKAEATGDVRMAALARVHLGRILRGLGDHTRARAALEQAAGWHRAVGGGEQAVLGECLLAAMDAADGVADAGERLASILDACRRADNAPAEVFALDALARLAAAAGDAETAAAMSTTADERMAAASHFIVEQDRVRH